jgi:membrane protein
MIMKKREEVVSHNKFKFKDLGGILKETFKDWNDDDAFTNAAAVSYYAIFALPAILILVINIAGALFGTAAVKGNLSSTIGKVVGADAGKQIETMVASAATNDSSVIMMVIGIATLIVSATGFFVQLQKALNRMWEVKTKDDAGMLKLLLDRTQSLGIILAVGFLLLISLVLTTMLSVLSNWITSMLPDFTIYLMYALEFIISFAVITVLFALIFKFLPDVHIEFRSVWVGAIVTAFLFMIAKFGMGFYFSKANPGSAYGAAGSIILLLLWIYYSCLLLFFGAEFTQMYAKRYGHKIMPSKHAIKVDPCQPIDPKGYTTT